jgi:hypothetical protein
MVFQRTTKLNLKLVDFSEFSTEKWISSLKVIVLISLLLKGSLWLESVLRIRSILMFLGLLDPDQLVPVRGMDLAPDSAPDPSFVKQKW